MFLDVRVPNSLDPEMWEALRGELIDRIQAAVDSVRTYTPEEDAIHITRVDASDNRVMIFATILERTPQGNAVPLRYERLGERLAEAIRASLPETIPAVTVGALHPSTYVYWPAGVLEPA